jgi:phosphoserine phosphatase RsbU/P
MKSDDHVTLTVVHYFRDGRLTWAGAHEDLLVFRAATGKCERLRTPGTWIGAVKNVRKATVDSTARLDAGDLLVLHTDGITEAPRGRERFGMDRLQAVVEAAGSGSAEAVRSAVAAELSRWMDHQDDDATLVVVKHGVEPAPRAAA